MTFLELAEKVLGQAKGPMSATEMWELAVAKGYDKELHSNASGFPANTLSATLTRNSKNPQTIFDRTYRDGRHVEYSLKTHEPPPDGESDQGEDGLVHEPPGYKEADLHPYLTYFLHRNERFKVCTRTIEHRKGKKAKVVTEWLHPDMIGVFYCSRGWNPAVVERSKASGNPGVKLYAFELKLSLLPSA